MSPVGLHLKSARSGPRPIRVGGAAHDGGAAVPGPLQSRLPVDLRRPGQTSQTNGGLVGRPPPNVPHDLWSCLVLCACRPLTRGSGMSGAMPAPQGEWLLQGGGGVSSVWVCDPPPPALPGQRHGQQPRLRDGRPPE